MSDRNRMGREKSPYSAPTLVTYGGLSKLTAGGTSGTGENPGMPNVKA